jgi:hypothetical protein
MVALKGINYGTRYCIFSIDSSSDLSSLPTQTSPGKGTLSTIRSCSMGSIAQAVDGNTYILTGNSNKWIKYSGNTSSPGTGGTVDIAVEPISEAQIYSLFDN